MHHGGAPTRAAWTAVEDEALRSAVARFGERDWTRVAAHVEGRSAKSCSDRWRNFLSPDIAHPRKNPFSPWEVAVVVQAHKEYANNWKAIAMLLPSRTNRAVKNLYVGNMKKGERLPARGENRFLDSNLPLEALLTIPEDERGCPVTSGSEGSFGSDEDEDDSKEGGSLGDPHLLHQAAASNGFPQGTGSMAEASAGSGRMAYGPGSSWGGEGEGVGSSSWRRAGVVGIKREGAVDPNDLEAYLQVAGPSPSKRQRGGSPAPSSPRTPSSRRGPSSTSQGLNSFGSFSHQSVGGAAGHLGSGGGSRLGTRSRMAQTSYGGAVAYGAHGGAMAVPESPSTPCSAPTAAATAAGGGTVTPGARYFEQPGGPNSMVTEGLAAGLTSIRTGISFGYNYNSCELMVPPDSARRISGPGPFDFTGPLCNPADGGDSTPLAPHHLLTQQQQGGASPITPPAATAALWGPGTAAPAPAPAADCQQLSPFGGAQPRGDTAAAPAAVGDGGSSSSSFGLDNLGPADLLAAGLSFVLGAPAAAESAAPAAAAPVAAAPAAISCQVSPFASLELSPELASLQDVLGDSPVTTGDTAGACMPQAKTDSDTLNWVLPTAGDATRQASICWMDGAAGWAAAVAAGDAAVTAAAALGRGSSVGAAIHGWGSSTHSNSSEHASPPHPFPHDFQQQQQQQQVAVGYGGYHPASEASFPVSEKFTPLQFQYQGAHQGGGYHQYAPPPAAGAAGGAAWQQHSAAFSCPPPPASSTPMAPSAGGGMVQQQGSYPSPQQQYMQQQYMAGQLSRASHGAVTTSNTWV